MQTRKSRGNKERGVTPAEKSKSPNGLDNKTRINARRSKETQNPIAPEEKAQPEELEENKTQVDISGMNKKQKGIEMQAIMKRNGTKTAISSISRPLSNLLSVSWRRRPLRFFLDIDFLHA